MRTKASEHAFCRTSSAGSARTHPKVRIEVIDGAVDLDLLRSLERGMLDLAFTMPPIRPGPFQSRTILYDPWVLVAQVGSEYANRPAPRTRDELKDIPLICFRSQWLDPLRSAGWDLDVVLRSDYGRVIHEFVAAGLGVALMPLLAVEMDDPRTTIIDLDDLIPPREIDIVWNADRVPTEAVEEFTTLAIEACAALGGTRRAATHPGSLPA